MIARTAVVAAILLCATSASSAQDTTQNDRLLPRAIADARVASVGLPTSAGWTPAVPAGTTVPGRALGFEVGGHLYPVRFKVGAIGFGGTYVFGRDRSSPPAGTASQPAVAPGVTTRLDMLVSQVSLNFGHRLGWSYIGGGLGPAHTTSEVSEPVAGVPTPVPADSGWQRAINYGVGARWFFRDHVAVSLDVRWYKLAAVDATPTRGALPRQSLLVASGGISIKD
jgi:opacity protein-like surface antigen